MDVFKEVVITATSDESWEDAATNAIERTEATVESVRWAVVQDQTVRIEDGEPAFRTKVKIGFEVQD